MAETFGRYQLLALIGKGGMAEIYRARLEVPAGAEKILVIKRILSSFSADPEFLRLFVNEAKIALPLTHGNITSVFDFGEVGGQYYLAMEYIHGQNLGAILRRCRETALPVPAEAALFMASEIAKGLAYAHGYTSPQGERVEVVHLDVSPQNVLISYDGAVKLTDFGIAKVRFSTEPVGKVVRGKASYLAPETLGGANVDGRADVFSLACVLYEMLTLRRPFQGDTDEETLEKAKRGEVERLSASRPDLSDVDEVLMRALEARPEKRYARASDFQVALTQVLFARNAGYGSPELSAWMRELFGWEIIEEQGASRTTTKDRLLYQLSRAQVELSGDKPTKELLSLQTVSIPAQDQGTSQQSEGGMNRFLGGGVLGIVILAGVIGLVVAGGKSLGGSTGLDGGAFAPPMHLDAGPNNEAYGIVSLNSWPSALVSIDGERLAGSTPILKRRVVAGTHKLVFERPELGLKKELTVEVQADTERQVAITLDR